MMITTVEIFPKKMVLERNIPIVHGHEITTWTKCVETNHPTCHQRLVDLDANDISIHHVNNSSIVSRNVNFDP